MGDLKAFCISLLQDLRRSGGKFRQNYVGLTSGDQGKPAHSEALLGKTQVPFPEQLLSWDINKKLALPLCAHIHLWKLRTLSL